METGECVGGPLPLRLVVGRVLLANLRQCTSIKIFLAPRFWARFFLANPRQVLARFDDISSFLLPRYLCRPCLATETAMGSLVQDLVVQSGPE